jgi:hypothetical protein
MRDWIKQATLVAALEYRLQLRTIIWRVVVVVGVILVVAMTSVSLRETERRLGELEILIARRDLLEDDGRHVISGFQRDEVLRAIRTPAPLSAVVTGLDKRVSQYWDFGPEGITAGSAFADGYGTSVPTANLDLEFVLRGLIGILALVAGFGSMVASRDGGPTKSLVSLPVAPFTMVAGAMAGGTLAASAAAALVVATAVITLLIGNPALLSPDNVWTMVLIWITSTVYSAVFVGLGTMVALLVRNTAQAVATVAVFWLVTTTIAGPMIGAIVEGTTRTRSRELFEVSRNSDYEKAVAEVETEAGQIVLAGLDAAEIPAEFQLTGSLRKSVEEHWDRSLVRLRSGLEALEVSFRQHEISRTRQAWWLGNALPGTAFSYAVTELAGVGDATVRRWTEDAKSFHRALRSAVFDNRPRLHMRYQTGSRYRVVYHDRAPLPTIAELPAFQQRVATPSARLRDATPSILALTLQCVAVWLAVGYIFRRRQSSPDGWR